MPEIEITPNQHERLQEVQEALSAEVVGKYGHVRVQDALEYLLDQYAADEATGGAGSEPAAAGADGQAAGTPAAEAGQAGDDREADEASADSPDATEARAVDSDGDEGDDGDGDDAMLDAMMNLLDEHDDKWGESGGDERYEVDLPDGTTEQVRTKDDVRARLFEHYR